MAPQQHKRHTLSHRRLDCLAHVCSLFYRASFEDDANAKRALEKFNVTFERKSPKKEERGSLSEFAEPAAPHHAQARGGPSRSGNTSDPAALEPLSPPQTSPEGQAGQVDPGTCRPASTPTFSSAQTPNGPAAITGTTILPPAAQSRQTTAAEPVATASSSADAPPGRPEYTEKTRKELEAARQVLREGERLHKNKWCIGCTLVAQKVQDNPGGLTHKEMEFFFSAGACVRLRVTDKRQRVKCAVCMAKKERCETPAQRTVREQLENEGKATAPKGSRARKRSRK